MSEPATNERWDISVRGIVQGVGFRPFIYSLALRHGLSGSVRNDAQGVHIEIEGPPENLDYFLRRIPEEAPPLAVVESITWEQRTALGETDFRIEKSRKGDDRRALIAPDMGICPDCLREMFDVGDRRYRYPFINCTNCGPRFSITRSVPYDRSVTTMSGFTMCLACRLEYGNPADRRFHAQPNACAVCGPRVRLVDQRGNEMPSDNPIERCAQLVRDGAILAVKGLGGFHLACDPFDSHSVRALRSRKVRQDKAFALMARDLAQARSLCRLDPEEEALLASPARPIVLLDRKVECDISAEVAPRQRVLGIMLAYTPLHHLLLHDAGIPLVMTSGNRHDEPIAYRDGDAFEQLGEIADYFLLHDRPIHMRCDDSVVRTWRGQPYPIRRSRGYAPAPLIVSQYFGRHILACGGELKNTFCLARENHVFVSHHIGDLENFETLRSFREGIEHYCRLFNIQPKLVAFDLHTEYLSTKYATELAEDGLPAFGIQHHHAHVAACLADNRRSVDERVIGVALDGTGFGTDGAIWGGEFLEGSIAGGFTRRAHLDYVPLPGGEAAIREPWRMAISHLLSFYSEEEILELPLNVIKQCGERKVRQVVQLIRSGLNSPPTSSAGRLFDAVAALLSVPASQRTTYEGQAAVELELAALGPGDNVYRVTLQEQADGWIIQTQGIVTGVVEDLLAGISTSEISARFHRTMAELILAGCEHIRRSGGPAAVALSGGAFQNLLLLNQVVPLLERGSFVVYVHRRVPASDGGLCLGQAVLANGMLEGTSQ